MAENATIGVRILDMPQFMAVGDAMMRFVTRIAEVRDRSPYAIGVELDQAIADLALALAGVEERLADEVEAKRRACSQT